MSLPPTATNGFKPGRMSCRSRQVDRYTWKQGNTSRMASASLCLRLYLYTCLPLLAYFSGFYRLLFLSSSSSFLFPAFWLSALISIHSHPRISSSPVAFYFLLFTRQSFLPSLHSSWG